MSHEKPDTGRFPDHRPWPRLHHFPPTEEMRELRKVLQDKLGTAFCVTDFSGLEIQAFTKYLKEMRT